MDDTDKTILSLLRRNGRMSFQELGDEIGMSRVAAKKRVTKLEEEGIIRGYNACIYREDEVTMLIDIVTQPVKEKYDEVLNFLTSNSEYIRQMYITEEYHIHIVAVSNSESNLKYLITMIKKKCGNNLRELIYPIVTDVIRNVYAGIK